MAEPQDRGPQLEGILIALLLLSIITAALRCYSMGVILKRFYVEDWLALVALALYCAYTAFALLGVHYGIGRHVEDVDPADRPRAVMWRWIASIFYIVVSTLTKLVVGLFLLRICSHWRWQRVTIWVLIGLVGLFNTFYVFIDIFACQPVEYEWTRYATPPGDGQCNSTLLATIPTYVSAFLNVAADWILAILPASLVWKAKMERRKKISVSAVLALGSVASIATIVRLPYAHGILDQAEYLYNFTDIAIWSTMEIGVALTASSLATLTPLFRKIKFFPSTSGTRDGNSAPAAGPSSRTGNAARGGIRNHDSNYFTAHNFVEISSGDSGERRREQTRVSFVARRTGEDKSDSDIEMLPISTGDSTTKLPGVSFYRE